MVPSSLPSMRGCSNFSTSTSSPGMAPLVKRPGMKMSLVPSSSMTKAKFLPSLTTLHSRALSARPERTVKNTP